jgi:hypothetical protein
MSDRIDNTIIDHEINRNRLGINGNIQHCMTTDHTDNMQLVQQQQQQQQQQKGFNSMKLACRVVFVIVCSVDVQLR